MTRTLNRLMAAACVALLLASCQKEAAWSGLELMAEGMGGGSKMTADGVHAYW